MEEYLDIEKKCLGESATDQKARQTDVQASNTANIWNPGCLAAIGLSRDPFVELLLAQFFWARLDTNSGVTACISGVGTSLVGRSCRAHSE